MSEKPDVVEKADRLVIPLAQRWAVPVLRIALAVVFLWFGVLKVLGVSPVEDMVAGTVYFFDPAWFVPLLGWVEILIGLGLFFRVALRFVVAVLLVQMVGTFLVFVIRPDIAFQNGNPLLLSDDGEFVLKNLVILGAGIVVGSQVDDDREEMAQSP